MDDFETQFAKLNILEIIKYYIDCFRLGSWIRKGVSMNEILEKYRGLKEKDQELMLIAISFMVYDDQIMKKTRDEFICDTYGIDGFLYLIEEFKRIKNPNNLQTV